MVGEYDSANKMLTQIPHNIAMMIEQSLDLPSLKVRVITTASAAISDKNGATPRRSN